MSEPRLSVMKLVGTGNDFLFIDGRRERPGDFAKASRAEIARKLCDRHFGLGSDGLVFVDYADGRFVWDFYNTDGSHAEMCGNASRCMGRWASLQLGASDLEFETAAGLVRVHVTETDVESYLAFASATPQLKTLTAAGREVSVYWLDTGVPHFVVKVDSIERARADLEFIRALRFHADGGLRGSNVTFLEIEGPSSFKTVTYERGVEDFTLSCGTGVIAAAAVGLLLTGAHSRVASVSAPGGALRVRFEERGVTLIGPATRIFETEIGPEILR